MARRQAVVDQRRYEVLSRMLKDRQSEIKNKLRSLRQMLPAEAAEVKDAEEQSMEDFVRGMDFALMEMESETLRKINDALLRLEEGTYGICAECAGKIAEARLSALPFASLCRDCQEKSEEEGRAPQRRIAFEEDPTNAAAGRGRRSGSASERPKLGPWGIRQATAS